MNGSTQGWFTAKNDSTKLIYSSNIKEETVVSQLYNREHSLIASLPKRNNIDTLWGVFEKGEKYKIHAIAKKAKGNFDFKME